MKIDTLENFPPKWRRKPRCTYENTRGIEPYRSLPELIDKIKKDGVNPVDFLNKKIANGIQVVGLGETHDDVPIRNSEIDIIRQLIEKSARPLKHLALEFPTKYQIAINSFIKTGNEAVIRKALPKFYFERNLQEILDMAHKKEIKIDCVDGNWNMLIQVFNPFQTKEIRDKMIHERIAQISRSDPKSLTLAILGSHHISHVNDANLHLIRDSSYPKLNDLLPDTYLPIAYHTLRKHDVKKFDINIPRLGLLVPTGNDKRFDATRSGTFSDFCGNFGGIIFVSEDTNQI